jgi:hypothetical protein
MGVSRHEVGAGVVAGAAASLTSILYLAGLWVLDGLLPPVPRTTELHFYVYTGFMFYALIAAPIVGLVVGTTLWRLTMSRASSARRGALVGTATAIGTVLAVPVLFGLLLAARELAGVGPVLSPSPLETFGVVSRGGLVYWSVLTGVVLVPLGALVGWLYQQAGQSRGP